MEQNHSTVQPPTHDKAALRRSLLAQRRALDDASRARWDAEISAAILRWQAEGQISELGVYWPIQGEPDLRQLWERLTQRGVRLALPLVQAPGAPLRFARWRPGMPMTPGAMKVPQPAAPEWQDTPAHLLIPCVAFNPAHFRLGYGGGFYDRTLAAAPHSKGYGVAYAFQAAQFAADAHDIAMHGIFCNADADTP
ncbi:5-formyltetrahydrofolate cyclo-ligase [Massilia sp. W12]|uniref:5-formyltetrahydrofolate cyclo-ligase n=1 Tax=Massilia sp. W12 TaxID=3126507 RepID=UPI0030CBB9ED